MPKQMDLVGIEAARVMAALSPETQRRFDKATWRAADDPALVANAFAAIGVAVGSKRQPIANPNKKKLFQFAEQLLKEGSHEVANAVATCFLEQVWQAAQNGGFDFSDVDRCMLVQRHASGGSGVFSFSQPCASSPSASNK